MEISAPRRPRRWSSACSGTLVRIAVGVVLLDGGPALYAEIIQLLLPRLRDCAVVIADNIGGGAEDAQPYAKWVRDPAHGFVSSSIVMKGGTEYSVWVGT